VAGGAFFFTKQDCSCLKRTFTPRLPPPRPGLCRIAGCQAWRAGVSAGGCNVDAALPLYICQVFCTLQRGENAKKKKKKKKKITDEH
jgi:hypothetical protein